MDKELLELGIRFHGHKCPAMPLGIRAGLAALNALGAQRASNKELYCILETGPAHAMMCFGDGVQVSTGCTFGKANIFKVDHGKTKITLIDPKAGRKVTVGVNPDFQTKALDSDFVNLRKQGVEPKDIDPAVTDPAVERISTVPDEQILVVGEVETTDWKPPKGTFEWKRCESCGDVTFATGLRIKDGKVLCETCAGYTT